MSQDPIKQPENPGFKRSNCIERNRVERKIKEIRKEYGDLLDHLTTNSKHKIETLSEMAKDYANSHPQHGPQVVVELIEDGIMQDGGPRCKLSILYLMHHIIKNHGEAYKSLFLKNLVETFAIVFRGATRDERVKMYRLRQIWIPYIPSEILHNLDVKIKEIDPEIPILPQELLDQEWRQFWSKRENRPYFYNFERQLKEKMWDMPLGWCPHHIHLQNQLENRPYFYIIFTE